MNSIFKPKTAERIKTNYMPNARVQFEKLGRFCNRVLGVKSTKKFSIKRTSENSEKIIEAMKQYSVSTQATYINYLFILFSKMYKREFPTEFYEYSKTVRADHAVMQGMKNQEELISLDNNEIYNYIKEKVSKSYRPSMSSLQKWIMIAILKELPLRLNEFHMMKWADDEENNYISVEKKIMFIRKHKNSKRIAGPLVFDLSEELIEDLQRYKQFCSYDYIFLRNEKPYGEPASEYSLCAMWKQLVKQFCRDQGIQEVNYGIHSLRHSFATGKLKELQIDPEVVKKLEELKKTMKHKNLETSLKLYLKTIGEDKIPVKKNEVTEPDEFVIKFN